LFQNPPRISPGTAWTLLIGWLFSLVGLMTLLVAGVSVRLAVARHRRVVDAFDALRTPLANRRLLLLTVTATERDAVLAALREATGRVPERSFTGRAVIFEGGAIGRTTVAMAQCARQGSGAPGGAQAIATEAIERWRPDFVIMVGICCGLREEGRPPQRLGDIVVATSIYDLDHRIQHPDHVEHTGDRVTVHTAMATRLQAASTDFITARVHFGLLLSAPALLESGTHREEIKTGNSRALAYDMEATGLYAAAAGARIPWTVVKAISDWGVDRDIFYTPKPAAHNAAAFVLHAIELGTYDESTESV
jgi:nucleoside phosphorylase